MANNLGSLVVSLGLDAADFTRGLSKSEYQAQQWARNFSTAVDAAATYALGSFAAIGAAIAVLDKQAQDVAAFQDLADKMGDTAEQAASLKGAADLSGVALDTVAGASVKLTAALSKTDDESKGVGLALKAIGLEVDAFKKLAPAEQMEDVARALAKFEDGAGKTAVAVQLFGKSGAELMPFLNDLYETGGRQVTLTGEQIKAADDYSKSLARLSGEVDTLAKITAADAAPELQKMVELLSDTFKYATSAAGGVDVFSAALNAARIAMEAVIVIGSDVAFTFRAVGREVGGLYAQLAALDLSPTDMLNPGAAAGKAIAAYAKGGGDQVAAIRQMMIKDGEDARKALDAFQAKVLSGSKAINAANQTDAESRRLGLLTGARPALSFSAAGGDSKAKKSSGKDPVLEANEKEAGMLKLLGDIRWKEVLAARKGDEEELAAIEKKNEAYQKWVQSLVDDTPTAKLDKQRETMIALADEYERGRFGAAGSADAIAKYSETVGAYLGTLGERAKEVNATANQAGDIFGSWLERAIADGAKLSDVVNGLIRDLALLAIRKSVIEPAAAGFSTWVGALMGGSSFDGGGYTGAGARTGGVDGKGGFPAILHPNETVIDHTKGQGMGGGGGVTVVQNLSIDARGADAGVEARIQSAMRQAKAEAVAEVQAKAARGGSYAASLGRA